MHCSTDCEHKKVLFVWQDLIYYKQFASFHPVSFKFPVTSTEASLRKNFPIICVHRYLTKLFTRIKAHCLHPLQADETVTWNHFCLIHIFYECMSYALFEVAYFYILRWWKPKCKRLWIDTHLRELIRNNKI